MRPRARLALTVLLVVSLLATQGAALAQPERLSVIIEFAPGADRAAHRAAVASVSGEITREFTIINGVAALVPAPAVEALRRNPVVLHVDLDVEVRAMDAGANTQISADQVWALGFTGSGVRLAILDTGIARTHPEFAGRIVACRTEVFLTSTCEDDNGHGTHVAGIAGGGGANAGAKGVAPGVSIMSDKVLNSGGSGSFSGIIAGINWAVANNADIISMSLGTSPVGSGTNCDTAYATLTSAVNNAVAAGVVVVAAAGNSGTSGLGAPGCISTVIAVGAVDSSDTLASFSARGAAMQDHGVVAPGVNLFSAWLGGGYAIKSGTSMATPAVSGVVALMLSKNPTQSPSAVRNIVFATADCVLGSCPNTQVGYGRVDALSAVNAVPAAGTFDFSMSINSASASVSRGGSTSPTVTTTLLSGTTQAITLSASVAPATSTISTTFSPASGNPTFSSSMKVATTASTPTGTYTITVTGNGGGTAHSTTFTLTVTAASTTSLTVTVWTDKATYPRPSWVYITVRVTNGAGLGVAGATVSVVVVIPGGGTAIGTGYTNANGYVTFRYWVSNSAPVGTYGVSAAGAAVGYTTGSGTTTFKVA